MKDNVHVELQHDFIGPSFSVSGGIIDLELIINSLVDAKMSSKILLPKRLDNIIERLKSAHGAMEKLIG